MGIPLVSMTQFTEPHFALSVLRGGVKGRPAVDRELRLFVLHACMLSHTHANHACHSVALSELKLIKHYQPCIYHDEKLQRKDPHV